MMKQEKVKFKFQGHEKFALRDGWLNKGLINVTDNPDVFRGKSGPDVFGVGSNMVKSIRYWLKAVGLVNEVAGKGACLSPIGEIIYENDLYLEDTFTLWVLHSYISKNKEEATTWYMYFNRCDTGDFTKEQLETILLREAQKYTQSEKFSENSVKNDVDVLLKMYSKSREIIDPEDKSLSPFAALALVKNFDGKYSKEHPERRIVSEWNILYELAEVLDTKTQISIEDVIYNDCGIAKIYQISPVLINELLDKLDTMGYIHVDRTAGLDMIYKLKDFSTESVMKEYYDKKR